jgi:trimeric autotransporter adhesin
MNGMVRICCMATVLPLGAAGIADTCISQWDNDIGQPGVNQRVHAMAIFDDGTGPALYAAGSFTAADGVTANRVARWNGAAWSPVGGGLTGPVNALTVFDDGTGPALYAAGQFSDRIAKWNGSTWAPLGSGPIPNHHVNALAVFDDGSGPALYAGGQFNAVGDTIVNRIAKWDGAQWTALGDGLSASVNAMAVYDDGGGPALFVGGEFTTAIESSSAAGVGCHGHCNGQAPEGCWCDDFCCAIGDCCFNKCEACGQCDVFGQCPDGLTVYYIAKWDGASWSALDGGVTSLPVIGVVNALAVHDGALIVGGRFDNAGTSEPVTVNNVARWDGTAWSPLGSGMDEFSNLVRALASLDHGDGAPALFAGGSFITAGGNAASRVARWDGEAWSPLGSGTSSHVYALAVFDSGDGPHLYVGGQFTTAGGEPANNIARWRACPSPPTCAFADLNCDGVVDVFDLLILLGDWGPCGDASDCPSDLSGDTVVDVFDLLALLSSWG